MWACFTDGRKIKNQDTLFTKKAIAVSDLPALKCIYQLKQKVTVFKELSERWVKQFKATDENKQLSITSLLYERNTLITSCEQHIRCVKKKITCLNWNIWTTVAHLTISLKQIIQLFTASYCPSYHFNAHWEGVALVRR